MSFCKDCISGVRAEGTPEGILTKVAGIDAYIATPTIDYPKDAVLLILSDVFGIHLPNNQLLADDFARNGFKVVMIDLFNGDAIPADTLLSTTEFDFFAWLKNHGADSVNPLIHATIASLKQEGVTKFYFTAYCFGARAAVDLAFEGIPKAVVLSHPSLLVIPGDLEKYKSLAKAPLLINSCEIDQMFPAEAQAQADEILTGFAPGYKRAYFAGCTHGFAVRGDMTKPEVKAGKEGAFKEAVSWFLKYQ